MNTVYVLQNSNFWDQALPVFVGALLAFALSVLGFVIQKTISNRRSKNDLLKNLKRELRYDISIIEESKKVLEEAITGLLAKSPVIFLNIKYTKMLSNFVHEAYRNGELFNILSEYDLAEFDDVLSEYTENNQKYLQNRLVDYNDKDSVLKLADIITTLQYPLTKADSHIRIMNDVIKKIDEHI